MRTSDRIAKENIVRVGTHPLGIGLYRSSESSIPSDGGLWPALGVMADEVEVVLPQAVVMHPHGYKMVDYALLGIDIAEHSVH